MDTKIKKNIVIALMGHVDHGKTALLDCLCTTNFLQQEPSNITQNVRMEYLSMPNNNKIILFDTPGHEYFSNMRTYVADLVDTILLVVDCTQGLQQQTKEVLQYNHKPIILVITKIDKNNNSLNELYGQLAQAGCCSDKIGGDVTTLEVSVKSKQGIQDLKDILEMTSECSDAMIISTGPAEAYIIDVIVSKRGDYSALIQIKKGVLKLKDYFVCGNTWGQVNTIVDYDKKIQVANGNHIVLISGFNDCPQVSNKLQVVDSKKTAIKQLKQQNRQINTTKPVTEEKKHNKCINILLKADNLLNLQTMEQILQKHNIIQSSISKIQNNDLQLLDQNRSIWLIVFGSVHPTMLQKLQQLKIKYIISDVIYDITSQLTCENTTTTEEIVGTATIIQLFNYKNNATVIVGCRINSGFLSTKQRVKIIRQDEQINTGIIASMQQNKIKITKAVKDSECAFVIKLDKMKDFTYQIGDKITAYKGVVETSIESLL